MHRNRSVNVHQFSMVPRADIPRSGFKIEHAYKTTFDAGYLIPVYVNEVLPGDTFNLRATMFARLATPLVPVMDNLHLESFFFFVPMRLVWDNTNKFFGERIDPADSVDYQIPTLKSQADGFLEGSVADYFGLPTEGQIGAGNQITVNALPFRAYNLIFNEWFRDQNLLDSRPCPKDDGPDLIGDYPLLQRGKRHDYFTSCLPWLQKGPSVPLALGGSAPVKTSGTAVQFSGVQAPMNWFNVSGASAGAGDLGIDASGASVIGGAAPGSTQVYPNNLYADLSASTAATINQIRQSFQIQKLLERDARGGTRYTEVIRSHFGVMSPDARLQRPEYLGGGHTPVNIHPVTQTSGTAGTGGYTDTPQGNLAAFGTALASGHGFTQSFTEHGYVIGLINVRADLGYQQGLHKMWTRKWRFDFYWPVFSHLGEQAVLMKEIYAIGTPDGTINPTDQDEEVWGYQERWAEYRYKPSLITGMLRSTYAQPLDMWHLAQHFTAKPVLNGTFISDAPPVDRIVATTAQTGRQFIIDIFFRNKCARPMPLYSVPGLVDHF